MTEEVSSKTAKAGDTFHGTIATNVFRNGVVLFPTGAQVTGRVVEAKPAGHLVGSALLTIELVSVRLPNAQDFAVTTEALSNRAAGRGGNTAAKAGGGAALGAIIGAVAGGGTGAAIGAVSGGALGTGANGVTRGQEIVVKPEQLLQFQISNDLEVPVTSSTSAAAVAGATASPQLQQRAPSSAAQAQRYDAKEPLDSSLNAKYDILGLRLGMTAKEALDVLAERFHIAPADRKRLLNVDAGNPQFVPGRAFTAAAMYRTSTIEVSMNFTEVPSGEGPGPEMLWNIVYKPILQTEADKKAFVEQVKQKFGEPVHVDIQEYYWSDHNYGAPLDYMQSGKPYVHLTSYLPSVQLSNSGIADHMKAVFNEQKTTVAPL